MMISHKKFAESELILNADGSIYHLRLKPEHLADDIIVVGDPKRVKAVSKYFDKTEFTQENRELITHTGIFRGKRITVISTGMGTDNIDIVINELDALVNIDLQKRELKDEFKSLNIIRIGTSGALQPDIPPDTLVASTHGLGFDGLIHFYKSSDKVINEEMTRAFIEFADFPPELPTPYIVEGSEILLNKIAFDLPKGITATAPGFFGPQGRELRIAPAYPHLNEKLENFRYKNHRIVNFEMETSALYGLGKMMNHRMLTVCVIIANRITKKYSKDYYPAVDTLVKTVLERISS